MMAAGWVHPPSTYRHRIPREWCWESTSRQGEVSRLVRGWRGREKGCIHGRFSSPLGGGSARRLAVRRRC